MARGFPKRRRRMIAALIRLYCAERYSLNDGVVEEIIDHSEGFFLTLPMRMRMVIRLVMWFFAVVAWFIPPLGRALVRKPLPQQQRVYTLWCQGKSYLAYLRRQMIHVTFMGSLYSHAAVHEAIGYQKVSQFDNSSDHHEST